VNGLLHPDKVVGKKILSKGDYRLESESSTAKGKQITSETKFQKDGWMLNVFSYKILYIQNTWLAAEALNMFVIMRNNLAMILI
jgi:hypothetical protein